MPTALFLWPALAPPSTTTSVSSTVLWFGLFVLVRRWFGDGDAGGGQMFLPRCDRLFGESFGEM